MNIECTDYKEFFDAFADAIEAGKDVIIESQPMRLKIGFTVVGEDTYWTRIADLRHAKLANHRGHNEYSIMAGFKK